LTGPGSRRRNSTVERRSERDLELAPHELPAYSRLLLDVTEADPTLSIRADEAEESWWIVEPILQACRSSDFRAQQQRMR
jgi:glucose-6-phosphate 1-dehydrogenase